MLNTKKFLALLLALMMGLSLVSTSAFAATVAINSSYLTVYSDGTYNATNSSTDYESNNLLTTGTDGSLDSDSEIKRSGDLTIYLAEGADVTIKSL